MKSELFHNDKNFLGFFISKNDIKVRLRKGKDFKTFSKTESIKDIQSSIWLLQLFRIFIPKFASLAPLIIDLTKKHLIFCRWDELWCFSDYMLFKSTNGSSQTS